MIEEENENNQNEMNIEKCVERLKWKCANRKLHNWKICGTNNDFFFANITHSKENLDRS